MLKSLEFLECGLVRPKSFQSATTLNRIIDLELSKHSSLEPCHTAGVRSLDIDKIDERYLLSGGKNGALYIHDLLNSTGRASYVSKAVCKIPYRSENAHRFSVDTVQWYPFDTGVFTSSGMDGNLKIWDTNSLRPVEVFNLARKVINHHMSSITTQHTLIAVGLKQPEIILLDPKSGSQTHELRGHSRSVTCVKWSPSSEYLLASGSEDSKIFFWDIRSAKGYLRTLDQHNGERGSNQGSVTAHSGIVCSLQFTSDSLHLVSYGTDSQLRLWDVALCVNTLVNFGRVYNSSKVRQRIIDLCCDSNPQIVFVPSANNVQLFDLLTGCRIKKLYGHFCDVHCCVFRSSAQQLYSAGNDMNILFWTPDVAQEIEEEKCMPKGSTRNIHEHSPHSDLWSSDED